MQEGDDIDLRKLDISYSEEEEDPRGKMNIFQTHDMKETPLFARAQAAPDFGASVGGPSGFPFHVVKELAPEEESFNEEIEPERVSDISGRFSQTKKRRPSSKAVTSVNVKGHKGRQKHLTHGKSGMMKDKILLTKPTFDQLVRKTSNVLHHGTKADTLAPSPINRAEYLNKSSHNLSNELEPNFDQDEDLPMFKMDEEEAEGQEHLKYGMPIRLWVEDNENKILRNFNYLFCEGLSTNRLMIRDSHSPNKQEEIFRIVPSMSYTNIKLIQKSNNKIVKRKGDLNEKQTTKMINQTGYFLEELHSNYMAYQEQRGNIYIYIIYR